MSFKRAATDSALFAGQLNAVQGELHRRIGAVELGHRRLACEGASVAAEPRSVVREQARRLQPGCPVREKEVGARGRVPLRERRTRLVERGLGDAKRLA